jgi:hypothetical protein
VLAAETGDPLRNARVALNDDFKVSAVLTDGNGRFVLTSVAPGQHVVSAVKTGYATTVFGARGTGRPIRVDMTTGSLAEGIDIRMPKAGAISGRVVDDRGEPTPMMTVAADRVMRIDGRVSLVRVATTETDDLGEYRLFGLPAGQFVVSTVVMPTSYPPAPVDIDGDTTWTSSFYPGMPGLNQAQPIKVRPGDDVPGIDFTARPTRQPILTIQLLDSRGNPAGGEVMFGTESPLSQMQFILGFGSGPADTSAKVPLDAGDWIVFARGTQGVALSRLTLGAGDASATITLAKGARLTGRIVTDGRPLPPGAAVEIDAFPLEQAVMRAGGVGSPAKMQADGTFELKDLIGLRELRLRTAPRGWTLRDVLAGDRSLLDSPVDFKGGEEIADARVVLTEHHSQLNGHVVTEEKMPVADYSVLVFAEDRDLLRNARRWARWVRPSLRGDFIVDDLLPGTYLVVAVDEVDDAQWLNADYLSQFRSHATRVTLGDGDNKTLVLEMTSTP